MRASFAPQTPTYTGFAGLPFTPARPPHLGPAQFTPALGSPFHTPAPGRYAGQASVNLVDLGPEWDGYYGDAYYAQDEEWNQGNGVGLDM